LKTDLAPIAFKHSTIIGVSPDPARESGVGSKIGKCEFFSYCSFIQALSLIAQGEELIDMEQTEDPSTVTIANLVKMAKTLRTKVIFYVYPF